MYIDFKILTYAMNIPHLLKITVKKYAYKLSLTRVNLFGGKIIGQQDATLPILIAYILITTILNHYQNYHIMQLIMNTKRYISNKVLPYSFGRNYFGLTLCTYSKT